MARVVFEITETMEIRDQRMLTRFLTATGLLEARVALDDFGTGFCTAEVVERIRPEFVKLDGQVVERADSTGDVREICRIRDLVYGYGGELIAECVDTERKVDAMRALGIRYLQGFYVGGLRSELSKNGAMRRPARRRLGLPVLALAGG